MNRHDSYHSPLRRFLAGGWDFFGSSDLFAENELTATLWIAIPVVSLITWVVWLGWKIIYFTFGGFAKEVMKEKEDDKK
jgi:hypothetical protein